VKHSVRRRERRMIVYVLFRVEDGVFTTVLNISYTALDSQRAILQQTGEVCQAILYLEEIFDEI